jgi:hypothetical protein
VELDDSKGGAIDIGNDLSARIHHRDTRYLTTKILGISSRRLSRFWVKEHARRKRLLLT